jgi:hypothetical protein
VEGTGGDATIVAMAGSFGMLQPGAGCDQRIDACDGGATSASVDAKPDRESHKIAISLPVIVINALEVWCRATNGLHRIRRSGGGRRRRLSPRDPVAVLSVAAPVIANIGILLVAGS